MIVTVTEKRRSSTPTERFSTRKVTRILAGKRNNREIHSYLKNFHENEIDDVSVFQNWLQFSRYLNVNCLASKLLEYTFEKFR